MAWQVIFPVLALLSLVLGIWQWLAARSFPLHRRVVKPGFIPPVTLLKPLKGCDLRTAECLASWLNQDYPGAVQILFGIDGPDDPVREAVQDLLRRYPDADAELVICGEDLGANSKVSKLAQLVRRAKYEHLIMSDADVLAPEDLLVNAIQPLAESGTGLVNCLYRLAQPSTWAMQWEAVACNTDFWSQVLQARTLKPMNFALGAVMAMRKAQLDELGGFEGIVACLADDYELGRKVARAGYRIELCPVVVDCLGGQMAWRDVWRHQLRWSRTIRVCQSVPYFFSILGNGTVWPLVWMLVWPHPLVFTIGTVCLLTRMIIGVDLQRRLSAGREAPARLWMIPLKDILQLAVWALAFTGNRVEWRGQRFRLRRDGTLVRASKPVGNV